MVVEFTPQINKVYFIQQYTLFQVVAGNGSIEVDFKHYFDWHNKIIYVEQGQYVKFLSDNFVVRKIEFSEEQIFRNKEVRVLFKHLVSLGYINFNECTDCQRYLNNVTPLPNIQKIIDASSKQWYWQNPFCANKEEYQLIFDVKEIIDKQYHESLTNDNLCEIIEGTYRGYKVQSLVKSKVGVSIKKLLNNKRLLEGKKNLAFTDKTIQEISFELGFNDAAYFHRIFKKDTGKSPVQFRNDVDFLNRDTFTQSLLELLQKHHTQEHSLEFYAQKLHLSTKALSKKVKDKLQVSLGQLIRHELVQSARKKLLQEDTVKDVALQLGFEEPNHFSAFFKQHTGITPTTYKKSNQ